MKYNLQDFLERFCESVGIINRVLLTQKGNVDISREGPFPLLVLLCFVLF
jgi:hypothetical protein